MDEIFRNKSGNFFYLWHLCYQQEDEIKTATILNLANKCQSKLVEDFIITSQNGSLALRIQG